MTKFTYNRETETIRAHATAAHVAQSGEAFQNPDKLGKICTTAELVAIWNKLPGVTPVKKFTDRATAITRVWTAIQSLVPEPAASQEGPAPNKPGKKATTETAAAPRESLRDKVIALLGQKGGATLDAIMEATSWQRHTVRGFISVLGSKHGCVIDSAKLEDGSRNYTLRKG